MLRNFGAKVIWGRSTQIYLSGIKKSCLGVIVLPLRVSTEREVSPFELVVI